jgi:fluoride exporter
MSFIGLWLAVGVLGGVGSVARFLLTRAVAGATGGRLTLGTLAVNLSGTIVLGVLVGASVGGDGYLLAGTATIGSYTTFSTWMLEAENDRERGLTGSMAANLLLSLALGLAAAWLGRRIAGG